MAEIRYFKKMTPANLPVLANGSKVQFTTLDHLVGYHATNNDYVANELRRFISEGRYGITEISAEEFSRDYIQKKSHSRPLSPIWREEVGVGALRATTLIGQLGSEHVAGVAAVDTEKPAKVDGASVTAPPPTADKVVEPVKVTTGKRPKKAEKK